MAPFAPPARTHTGFHLLLITRNAYDSAESVKKGKDKSIEVGIKSWRVRDKGEKWG